MKAHLSASLLLAALALPVSALADAGSAAANAVTGSVMIQTGNTLTPISANQTVGEGSIIQTGPQSGVTLSLPGGGRMILAANTRIRIRAFSQGADASFYSLEIILTSGRITGDATRGSGMSNFTVRTTAGVANVTGSTFSISFAPAGTSGGTLNTAVATGQIRVTPLGTTEATIVQSGNVLTVTTTAAGSVNSQLNPLSSGNSNQIIATLSFDAPTDSTTGSSNRGSDTGTPNQSSTIVINLSTLNPMSNNGEGDL